MLPGVTLTVTNAETGVARTAVTEADGRYRFAGLQPGRYDLKAELQGFGTVEVKSIVLTVGLEYPKDIQMGVQTLQESVTVTGETPVVETTRTEVGAVVTQEQISILPVQGNRDNAAMLAAVNAYRASRVPWGVFNLFGTDNLGGIGTNQTTNALAATFGQIPSAQPRQQGEIAIRYIW